MTKLKSWYLSSSKNTKRKYLNEICLNTGVCVRTVYRWLDTHAPILAQKQISQFTGITINHLYNKQ